MKAFPQELVDSVLDDYGDLKLAHRDWAQYSLVCRAWLPATRRRLFSRIETHPRNSREYKGRTTSSFLGILDNDACTFIPFVTHLSLEGVDMRGVSYPGAFQTLLRLPAVASVHFNVWSFELAIHPLQDYLSRLGSLTELSLKGTVKSTPQLFSLLERCSFLTSLDIAVSIAVDWTAGFGDIQADIARWSRGKIPGPPAP